jgi:hypothetical protein
LFVEQNRYKLDAEADAQVRQIFQRIERLVPRLTGFANARTVRQIFEAVTRRASNRAVKEGPAHCDLDLITASDTRLSDDEVKNILGV